MSCYWPAKSKVSCPLIYFHACVATCPSIDRKPPSRLPTDSDSGPPVLKKDKHFDVSFFYTNEEPFNFNSPFWLRLGPLLYWNILPKAQRTQGLSALIKVTAISLTTSWSIFSFKFSTKLQLKNLGHISSSSLGQKFTSNLDQTSASMTWLKFI